MKFSTISIIFLLVGIGTLTGAFFLMRSNRNLQGVEATVVDVVEVKDYYLNSVYYPFCRYSTNQGEVRTNYLDSPVDKTDVGKTIKIMYSDEDPEIISKTSDRIVVCIILIFIGLSFFFLGIWFMIILSEKWTHRLSPAYTMDSTAQVVGFRESTLKKHGRYGYYIKATYTDLATNEKYDVTSKTYWLTPKEFTLPPTVKIKFDPQLPSQNWMDTTFLEEAIREKNRQA